MPIRKDIFFLAQYLKASLNIGLLCSYFSSLFFLATVSHKALSMRILKSFKTFLFKSKCVFSLGSIASSSNRSLSFMCFIFICILYPISILYPNQQHNLQHIPHLHSVCHT